MNRLARTGLVLFVVGLLLAVGGEYAVRSGVNIQTTFSQPSSGEYLSTEIASSKSVAIVITSPAQVGGLIPAQDANVVSSSNIGSYAIASNSSSSATATYIGLRGNYYYVVFSSAQPASKVAVTRNLVETAVSGLAFLIGIVIVIAGIVCAVVGFRRGRRSKPTTVSDAEYYAKRADGTTAGPQ